MAGRGTDIMLGGNLEHIVKGELAKKGYTQDIIEMAITPISYDDEQVKKAKEDIKELEDKLKPEIEENKKKVIEAGGLKIIGSERHESRRIDNQLRGRAGRQGDVGETRFYISLEDDLMKLFASDKITQIANMMGLPEDMPLEQKMLTNAIETAQKRVEGRNYSIRKNVLEYDDVMNTQREIIYSQRREVLNTENIEDIILQLAKGKTDKIVESYFKNIDNIDDIDFETVNLMFNDLLKTENFIKKEDIEDLDTSEIYELVDKKVKALYEDKLKEAEKINAVEPIKKVQRYMILSVVNNKWMDHIDAISQLKDGIGLRAYGQKNPVEAYKIESYDMFESLIDSIQEEATKSVFALKVKKNENYEDAYKKETKVNISNITTNENPEDVKKEPVRVGKKIGRNQMCPCGSGKKYKNCCGRNK